MISGAAVTAINAGAAHAVRRAASAASAAASATTVAPGDVPGWLVITLAAVGVVLLAAATVYIVENIDRWRPS